ncbi:MAG TPA: heavy-metal-associated domain-containing protein [Aggregatilineales bacterium]|nr:heavy-metal-associated domain-containing protein [Aggregatilineales bacterium]
MQSKTVSIPDISCGHCVMTIEHEVAELAGVVSVKADQQSKQAIFKWEEPATWSQIEALLREIEYPPAN